MMNAVGVTVLIVDHGSHIVDQRRDDHGPP